MKSRTEIKMLLRQCVDDVRKEISLVTPRLSQTTVSSSHAPSSTTALPISISCFQKCDRERSLELLLSQDRVLHLLSANILPTSQRYLCEKECAVIHSSHCHPSQNTANSDMLISTDILDSISILKSEKIGDFEIGGISGSGSFAAPVIAPNIALSCAVTVSVFDSAGTRLPAI